MVTGKLQRENSSFNKEIKEEGRNQLFTMDFIGNKVFGHRVSGFLLRSTRRLFKLQAMTMTKSEKPSLVLRNKSFTHRERVTPAMAYSTLTRTLDILRLFAFSFSVSSFLRVFRLNVLIYLGFVALKACVLKQSHAFRVSDPFFLSHLLVMGFAWSSLAQVRNSLFLDGGNGKSLPIGMRKDR